MEPKKEKIERKITKETLQKGFKNAALKRRMQIIKSIIKKVGFRNARKRIKTIQKTYKISERVAYKDFDWIKNNIKPDDRKEIKITVRVAIDNALDEALERFVSEPTIENSKNIMAISKGYREELEAWGEKEKVADKVEHEGLAGTFNLVTKSIKEIKDAKTKNTGKGAHNKPKARRNN